MYETLAWTCAQHALSYPTHEYLLRSTLHSSLLQQHRPLLGPFLALRSFSPHSPSNLERTLALALIAPHAISVLDIASSSTGRLILDARSQFSRSRSKCIGRLDDVPGCVRVRGPASTIPFVKSGHLIARAEADRRYISPGHPVARS